MLFNSYFFVFTFLPIVFIGYFYIGRINHAIAMAWLALASLFFYGWWDYRFTGLLFISITINYLSGFAIARHLFLPRAWLLSLAIAFNLLLLGYFKYFNFFIENINQLSGTTIENPPIILPLGISFFTFTQIAFLVDCYQNKAREFNFVHYTLFVTFFPHLIAGPVLHHKEMMPQFASPSNCKIDTTNVAVGVNIFILGLAKKVLIADSLAECATPIFTAVHAGGQPMFVEAWIAAFSYTFQLYFDFSAYSDMAIGLSLIFNVRLPLNFDSPYKSSSIIEFWRRWHMSLSRFLRDYLYIPLGGNRKGTVRRHFNLIITMLLGGLWHGAGWPFLIWGGLHGCFLIINHGWIACKQYFNWSLPPRAERVVSCGVTFLAVVIGWVIFRAETLADGITILQGMAGLNGCSLNEKLANSSLGEIIEPLGCQLNGALPLTGLHFKNAVKILLPSFLIVFFLPNLKDIFYAYKPALDLAETNTRPSGIVIHYLHWKPTIATGWITGLLFVYTVLQFTKVSEFLYFRF